MKETRKWKSGKKHEKEEINTQKMDITEGRMKKEGKYRRTIKRTSEKNYDGGVQLFYQLSAAENTQHTHAHLSQSKHCTMACPITCFVVTQVERLACQVKWRRAF